MESVGVLAKERVVVIVSKSSCCLCHSIKALFHELGVNAMVHELDENPRGREIEMALLNLGGKPAVPTVFTGGAFIGSTNEVMACHLNGSLIPLLKRAGAIWL